MITSMIICVLLLIGIWHCFKKDKFSYDGDFLMSIFAAVIVVYMLIIGLVWLCNSYDSSKMTMQREMLTEMNYNDNKLGQFERIKINEKIVEFNEKLAGYKYDRKGFFKYSVNAKVEKMEYIRQWTLQ